MSNSWTNEPIKITLTFDKKDSNGNYLQYIVYHGLGSDDEDNYATELSIDENEANTTGNPLGVMTANTCNVSIFDKNNYLAPNNTNSPYYGYMRNGVKIELDISYDGGTTYEDYGTYYVTDWDTGYSEGYNDVAIIAGADKIQYVANMDIPKLPAYNGVTLQTLAVNLFIALDRETDDNTTGAVLSGSKIPVNSIGNDNDYYTNTSGVGVYKKVSGSWQLIYYIDSRLDISMNYGITVGSKIMEVFNSMAQALTARIILDRSGVIRIVKSLEGYGSVYELTDELFISGKSKHNTNNIYNKVTVSYNKAGEKAADTLVSNDSITLTTGVNTFSGLQFGNKSLDIEDVYFETPDSINGTTVVLSNITYQAYQDGVDITVSNDTGVEVPGCNLIVDGRYVNTSTAKESSTVSDTDAKVANELTITTDLIQTQTQAKTLASNISDYLLKTNKLTELTTILTPKVTEGDVIIVDLTSESASSFNGTYKVTESNTTHGLDYTKVLTMYKISSSITWSDAENWIDSDENNIWIEGGN